MDSGTRMPTWRERENNKRRERRRRAIAAKIYAGLRIHGNFKLPKHCDNNAVLKALCEEAGWTVEEDGTTYRKGCKPVDRLDAVGPSASPSPCSSYHPSPCASYNPSPTSSTLASPASSNLITTTQNTASGTEGNSLSPWLKSLSSASSSTSISSKLPNLPHIYIPGGSLSAPVTPPLSSPISQSPRIKTDWNNLTSQSSLACLKPISLPSSMPPSPGSQVTPDAVWFAGLSFPSGPTSPTYSLVSSNPLDFLKEASSSRMWTPGQSGTCSPVPPGGQNNGDVPTSDGGLDDFAFGSSSNGTLTAAGLVTPWEGERIHEECASDDLELTLGTAKAKSVY